MPSSSLFCRLSHLDLLQFNAAITSPGVLPTSSRISATMVLSGRSATRALGSTKTSRSYQDMCPCALHYQRSVFVPQCCVSVEQESSIPSVKSQLSSFLFGPANPGITPLTTASCSTTMERLENAFTRPALHFRRPPRGIHQGLLIGR
jgi:hypothetical protein